MTGISAVGVDDDLPACQAGVALRSADNKSTGRVDKDLCVAVEQLSRDHRTDNVLYDILPDLFERDVVVMLSGYDDGVYTLRLVAVIFDSHLSLAVGTEIRQGAVLADSGKTDGELLRKRDRERHELRGLVAGKTEHHALITGSEPVLGRFLAVFELI